RDVHARRRVVHGRGPRPIRRRVVPARRAHRRAELLPRGRRRPARSRGSPRAKLRRRALAAHADRPDARDLGRARSRAPHREPRRAGALRPRPHGQARARRIALGRPRAARARQPADPRVPRQGVAAVTVGVPREIKPGEQRVALTPAGARALAEAGHQVVVVERGAGAGSGIRDDEYAAVGAALATPDEGCQRADLVLKVKEPLPAEYPRLRPGQILFTYLHLAPAPELARALRDSGPIAIG